MSKVIHMFQLCQSYTTCFSLIDIGIIFMKESKTEIFQRCLADVSTHFTLILGNYETSLNFQLKYTQKKISKTALTSKTEENSGDLKISHESYTFEVICFCKILQILTLH